MRRSRALAAILLAGASAACAAAVRTGPSAFVPRALAMARGGDTASALALLDSAVRREFNDAGAWHLRGMLAWERLRGAGDTTVMRERALWPVKRMADTSLLLAYRLAPDSGWFALDYGRYLVWASRVEIRVQSTEPFRRALALGRAQGDSVLVAEAADELGSAIWQRYEGVGATGRVIVGNVGALPRPTGGQTPEERHAAQDFVLSQVLAPHSPEVDLAFVSATERFREAITANPRHRLAPRHMMMVLAERARWEDLRQFATERLRADASDALPWLALGVANWRLGDVAAASPAFDSALARMDAPSRARYTNIARIMRPADTARYAAAPPAEKAELERVYWALSDPLTLTRENEHRLEFLARLAFADLRWSRDDWRVLGGDSERGQTWVRYGPPGTMAALSQGFGAVKTCEQQQRRTRLVREQAREARNPADEPECDLQESRSSAGIWYYPELNFYLHLAAAPGGPRRPMGTVDTRSDLEEAADSIPVSWRNVAVSREMDSVAVQIARFRAPGDSMDLAVYAEIPIRRLVRGVDVATGPVDVALTLLDTALRPVSRDSVREMVTFARPDAAERRTIRRRMPREDVVFRVEALQPMSMRGARAMGTIEPAAASGMGMSDLVVADRVLPIPGREATRWSDLAVVPSAGVFRKGQSIGVFWESYGLESRGGSARYTVDLTLTVLELTRSDFVVVRVLGGIADAIGLSAKGDDRVNIHYERTRADPAVGVDYLTLEVGDSPPGRYRLTVRVTDVATGRTATATRALVIAPEAR